MAKKKTDVSKPYRRRKSPMERVETVPLPESGERVVGLPPTGSKFRKAPTRPTAEEGKTARRATLARRKWESSEEGQQRTADPFDAPGWRGLNRAQIYRAMEGDRPSPKGPSWFDVQLPGMADPDAAPRPPRWEELPEEARAHTVEALKKYGTSPEQMARDFGMQLDQAKKRQWSHGAEYAHAEDFYSHGEPKQVVMGSAKELGIPPLIHAQMNAMTSPNTKFSSRRQSTGEQYFPNDEAAAHAVRWVQQGGSPQEISNVLETTGTGTGKAQGYVTNLRKAAEAFSQHQQGVAPADWKTGKGESNPFAKSPKTGPYANAWSDSHPEFFVSDVHSGGGGFFPHLSSEKPILKDAEGNPILGEDGKPKRDKSEREKALSSIPFVHSLNDYIARQAAAERGMKSLKGAQGAQWGEEQLQRGLVKEGDVYPQAKKQVPRVNPDQFTLFD